MGDKGDVAQLCPVKNGVTTQCDAQGIQVATGPSDCWVVGIASGGKSNKAGPAKPGKSKKHKKH